jgi:hypothetical protein
MTFQQEFSRNRDCTVLFKGDCYTVSVSPSLIANGWQGGQGVVWDDSPKDEFRVTYSDGLYGGFLLEGSEERPVEFTSQEEQQPTYGYGVFCAGGWLVATRTYEQFTYASRIGPGPLVPINYVVGQRVVFSLRGFFTNEDEWTLSGDPRAPNHWYVANVVQAPSADTDNYITLQTSI